MFTKTTKTVLFAALLVAMVLPFSGMQSVHADVGSGVADGTPITPVGTG